MKTIMVREKYDGITMYSGELLFQEIAITLIEGKKVTIDLFNQKYLTAVFLNPAIGRLFSIFKTVVVINDVIITGETEEQFFLIDRIMKNSDKYWNNNEYRKAVDNATAKISEEMSR